MKKSNFKYINYLGLYIIFFILGCLTASSFYNDSLSKDVLGVGDTKEKIEKASLEITFERDTKENIFSLRDEYFIKLKANKNFYIPAFYRNLNLHEMRQDEFILHLYDLKFGINEFNIPFMDGEGDVIYYNPTIYRVRYKPVGQDRYKWLDGDNLLSVVDKNFFVEREYNPKDLVYIYKYDVPQAYKGTLLREEAAINLSRLIDDSRKEKLILIVLSGYRSYDKQQETYNFWLRYAGEKEANNRVAKPGHSEHQLGTAVDFTTYDPEYSASKEFEKTEEGKWLAKNAYKYGFVLTYPEAWEDLTGYQYEPWHFRYVGKKHAKEIKKRGTLPITYLKEVNYIQEYENKDFN